jgi:hypothetical protein
MNFMDDRWAEEIWNYKQEKNREKKVRMQEKQQI